MNSGDNKSKPRSSAEKGRLFELAVIRELRALGYRVARNVGLDGDQVDIFASEESTIGIDHKILVECKGLESEVGIADVNEFGLRYLTHYHAYRAKSAIMVSKAGFTAQASAKAIAMGIELFVLEDLQHHSKTGPGLTRQALTLELPESLASALISSLTSNERKGEQ